MKKQNLNINEIYKDLVSNIQIVKIGDEGNPTPSTLSQEELSSLIGEKVNVQKQFETKLNKTTEDKVLEKIENIVKVKQSPAEFENVNAQSESEKTKGVQELQDQEKKKRNKKTAVEEIINKDKWETVNMTVLKRYFVNQIKEISKELNDVTAKKEKKEKEFSKILIIEKVSIVLFAILSSIAIFSNLEVDLKTISPLWSAVYVEIMTILIVMVGCFAGFQTIYKSRLENWIADLKNKEQDLQKNQEKAKIEMKVIFNEITKKEED